MKNKILFIIPIVIAVTVIVIIIVNKAKTDEQPYKMSFNTEIQLLYSEAADAFIEETKDEIKHVNYGYGKVNGNVCDKIANSERELLPVDVISNFPNVDYYIEFAPDGRVVKYYVTDGEYQFQYEGNGLNKEDAIGKKISEESEVVKILEGTCDINKRS